MLSAYFITIATNKPLHVWINIQAQVHLLNPYIKVWIVIGRYWYNKLITHKIKLNTDNCIFLIQIELLYSFNNFSKYTPAKPEVNAEINTLVNPKMKWDWSALLPSIFLIIKYYYIYILAGCTKITPIVSSKTENHWIKETFLCNIQTEKNVVVIILHWYTIYLKYKYISK